MSYLNDCENTYLPFNNINLKTINLNSTKSKIINLTHFNVYKKHII